METSATEVPETHPSWSHAQCDRCWWGVQGHVLYTDCKRYIRAVIGPPKRNQSSLSVTLCCVCGNLCRRPQLIHHDPDGMFCEHEEDGTLLKIPSYPAKRA